MSNSKIKNKGKGKKVKVFSSKWMEKFAESWNKDKVIVDTLASINFDSVIGYGFKGEENPIGVLIVKKGVATEGKEYEKEELSWDLRCTPSNWEYYLENGFSLFSLGRAYTMGYIQFKVGDYFSMIKNPKMISPFLGSFEVMKNVHKSM